MITLHDEIAEVRRELNLHRAVYPRWVVAGKMTAAEAHRHMDAMAAVLRRLERIQYGASEVDEMIREAGNVDPE